MTRPRSWPLLLVLCVAPAVLLFGSNSARALLAQQQRVDFSRDVQPILKAHCFQCHSAERKEGGLRLDLRSAAFKGGIGGPLLTVGNGVKSLLIQRILGAGGKARMPLGFAPLSAEQTRVVRTWLDQGAD